jgi:uncharacterized protein involved in exopolysaccharide biosynthesis
MGQYRMTELSQADVGERTGGGAWFLNHLPAILWQRRYYIILPFLLVLAGATVVAYALPTLYRSTATLLVESADLPADIAQTPKSDIEDRIAKIREQILSRGELISLIQQNGLYGDERRSKPMSYVVDKMRRATMVGALDSDIGNGTGGKNNVIAVSLSFDYPEPAKAQAVMQGYVSGFLRKDSDETQDQADVTVRFLQDEATKLQSQIQDIESRITTLKSQNGAALAGGGGGPMLMDTGSYTAQISSLEEQNRQLLAQSQTETKDPDLAAAETALAKARAMYSDSHPDVIQARARVEELKRAAPKSDGPSTIQQQIQANNAAIAQLRAERDQAIGKANAAAAGQARAPAILEEASQLENQANTLRDQYKDVAANLLKAQGSARLASEQRGERLSLVDPANLPDQPQWPNRPLLIAAGALAGIVLGMLLALAVELLNRPMRSPGQIEGLGLPVLGVVPIFEAGERKQRLRLLRKREASVA